MEVTIKFFHRLGHIQSLNTTERYSDPTTGGFIELVKVNLFDENGTFSQTAFFDDSVDINNNLVNTLAIIDNIEENTAPPGPTRRLEELHVSVPNNMIGQKIIDIYVLRGERDVSIKSENFQKNIVLFVKRSEPKPPVFNYTTYKESICEIDRGNRKYVFYRNEQTTLDSNVKKVHLILDQVNLRDSTGTLVTIDIAHSVVDFEVYSRSNP
jgi:hypothetical protein